jgi:very-short-patch-repair endonuclease
MPQQKFPRDFLLAELKRVAAELGKIPTIEEFRRSASVAPETLISRFRSWSAALKSAGFDPTKARLTYQDVDMIEEIRRVAEQLGRTPATTEFDQRSEFSASRISQRLGGSWSAACRAAGLPPFVNTRPPSVRGGWNKGQRKFSLDADELRYVYEREGLSAAAIAKRYGVGANSVRRRLKECGIETRRLHYTMPRATSIEEIVYTELERRGVTFVKQQVVDGLWVVDALVPGAKLVIECDGQYWHSLPDMEKRDKRKDAYLRSRGYQVFRFPEAAIHADVRACVQRIVDALVDRFKER